MKFFIFNTKSLFVILVILFSSVQLFSQGVGINNTGADPDASTMLDVLATDKGVLIPRVANTGAVSNPAHGLLIFNETDSCVYINQGSSGTPDWLSLCTTVDNKGVEFNSDGTVYVMDDKDTLTSISAAWLISGNSGIDASTDFIGTTDAVDLVIKTDDTEQMRVKSNGYVGIGTSSPYTKLQVSGIDGASSAIRNSRYSSDSYGSSLLFTKSRGATIGSPGLLSDGDEIGLIKFYGNDGAGNELGAEIVAQVDGTAKEDTMCTELRFNTRETSSSSLDTKMIIKANGRVGIGTDSPNAKLQLSGDDATSSTIRISRYSNDKFGPYLRFTKSNTNTIGSAALITDDETYIGRIEFTGNDGDSYESGAEIRAMVDSFATVPADEKMPASLRFLTQDSLGVLSYRMTVASNGKIGVGTTSPEDHFHIQSGNIEGTKSLLIDCDGDDADYPVRIRTNSAGGFSCDDTDTKLVVDGLGYMGMGIDTPGVKLHLSGTSLWQSSMRMERYTTGGHGPYIRLAKSYNDVIGTQTQVPADEALGIITFGANTGSKFVYGPTLYALHNSFPTDSTLDADLIIGHFGNGNEPVFSLPKPTFVVKQSGRVGLGTKAPTMQLQVYHSASLYAGMCKDTTVAVFGLYSEDFDGNTYGGYFENSNDSNNGDWKYGVYGVSNGDNATKSGVRGESGGTGTNYGGRFTATNAAATSNYGVYGAASNASGTNYAGYFVGDIFGSDDLLLEGSSTPSVTINATTANDPYFCLKFEGSTTPSQRDWYLWNDDGELRIRSSDNDGTVYNTRVCMTDVGLYPYLNNAYDLGSATNQWKEVFCVTMTESSDKRMKKNIFDLNYGLNDIMKLRPVTFERIDDSEKGREIGFIAQEVLDVIPEVVSVGDDAEKTMGMNYSKLTSLIVKAMQEQQEMITTLEDKNTQLENDNAALKADVAEIKEMLLQLKAAKQIVKSPTASKVIQKNVVVPVEPGLQTEENVPFTPSNENVKVIIPATEKRVKKAASREEPGIQKEESSDDTENNIKKSVINKEEEIKINTEISK